MNKIKHLLAAILFLAIAHSCTASQAARAEEAVVDAGAFGAAGHDGSDTVMAVRAALEHCRKTGARKLVFPKGRYDFWPSRAVEKYVYVSNNDDSLKRIAFDLSGMKNFEIDGQGSEFLFHGFVCPILLDHAEGITLKNFSVNYARTFHSEGTILAVREGNIDFSFSDQFPYKIENGLLIFTDSEKIVYPYSSLLEFDPKKRETAYQAWDYWTGPNVQVQEIGKGQLRMAVPNIKATVGNVMVFAAGHRLVPAITISDSTDTKISDVNLYHCGGMGVIAQRSRNISLNQVKVTPAPGSGRTLSITADATHFVNCSGKIEISHCLFENQTDDATNIHGIYARVERILSSKEIEVKLVHPQQYGFDFITAGEKLELVHGASMVTFGEATPASVARINREYTRVRFDAPLPKDMKEGDAVASLGQYPEVNINHCIIRGNRARGILLGSRAKMVIEDNLFRSPGAAILFEGDARFWFEQAGVRDCVIRRNTFDNCNFGVWGKACIEVGSGIDESCRAESRYNRCIVIEDNTFRIFQPRLVDAYSVDGLTFRNNRIEKTTAYPPKNEGDKPFNIEKCDNMKIEP